MSATRDDPHRALGDQTSPIAPATAVTKATATVPAACSPAVRRHHHDFHAGIERHQRRTEPVRPPPRELRPCCSRPP